MGISPPWLVACAAAFAFLFAVAASTLVVCLARKSRFEAKRREALLGVSKGADRGLEGRVISYLERCTREVSVSRRRGRLRRAGAKEGDLLRDLKQAGIAGLVDCSGFSMARVRLAFGGLLVGALFGAVFSLELAFALAVTGAVAGLSAPRWAVRSRKKARASELERHLSEMLEVVSLGLRSGLSFDRSIDVYGSHFDTLLSHSFTSAKRQWVLGLSSREESLRAVAESYDSVLLSRCIEAILRSLRYGSSLAESLEAIAAEARSAYRATKQEQIAKAPVKMMVPTGALMLPAMLLLVLGPILLELIDGF